MNNRHWLKVKHDLFAMKNTKRNRALLSRDADGSIKSLLHSEEGRLLEAAEVKNFHVFSPWKIEQMPVSLFSLCLCAFSDEWIREGAIYAPLSLQDVVILEESENSLFPVLVMAEQELGCQHLTRRLFSGPLHALKSSVSFVKVFLLNSIEPARYKIINSFGRIRERSFTVLVRAE